MYLVGLTGGIASGKSTVSRMLADLGAAVIDADQISRKVVEPGTEGLNLVRAAFGESVIHNNSELDRQALAELVFSDPKKREELEIILHPLIKKETLKTIAEQDADVVVYAVPLLVEAKVDYPFDLIVTTECRQDQQIQRLVDNRGLTVSQATQRIEAQTSRATREASADFIIDNSGTLEDLESQVEKLWAQIQASIRKPT